MPVALAQEFSDGSVCADPAGSMLVNELMHRGVLRRSALASRPRRSKLFLVCRTTRECALLEVMKPFRVEQLLGSSYKHKEAYEEYDFCWFSAHLRNQTRKNDGIRRSEPPRAEHSECATERRSTISPSRPPDDAVRIGHHADRNHAASGREYLRPRPCPRPTSMAIHCSAISSGRQAVKRQPLTDMVILKAACFLRRRKSIRRSRAR